jgi:hypothetical protein
MRSSHGVSQGRFAWRRGSGSFAEGHRDAEEESLTPLLRRARCSCWWRRLSSRPTSVLRCRRCASRWRSCRAASRHVRDPYFCPRSQPQQIAKGRPHHPHERRCTRPPPTCTEPIRSPHRPSTSPPGCASLSPRRADAPRHPDLFSSKASAPEVFFLPAGSPSLSRQTARSRAR